MKDKFTYKLKTPVSVAIEGKDIKASDIIVRAPRPKDKFDALQLEALFKQAMMKAFSFSKDLTSSQDDSDKKEDDDAAIDGIITLVMMGAENGNIRPLINILSELLTSGNEASPQATINGVKMTKPMIDELSLEDTKYILGGYIYHFLSST